MYDSEHIRPVGLLVALFNTRIAPSHAREAIRTGCMAKKLGEKLLVPVSHPSLPALQRQQPITEHVVQDAANQRQTSCGILL